MGSMTNAFEKDLLKHIVGQASWSPPDALYAGLLTAVGDGESGAVTECADAAYSRRAVDWSAVAGGATHNGVALRWPAAAVAYTVVGVALYADDVGGAPLFVDDVEPTALSAGDSYEIAAGDLDLAFD